MGRIFPTEVLTSRQMTEADRLTVENGTPGYSLMQRAGKAVVAEIIEACQFRKALVLCGPGNNGGDGFVIARLLRERGWAVRVACLVSLDDLRDDAAHAARDWRGGTLEFEDVETAADELVVDAVFGTGFRGQLEEPVTGLFDRIRVSRSTVVAVDIPSGVSGDTGEADPKALRAALTVTFFRKKIGHLLLPGMAHCGILTVHDIGIENEVLETTRFALKENVPAVWRAHFRRKRPGAHKYDYGHAVILGGARMTGATLLAAHATLRIGAGICTVLGVEETSVVYRSYLPSLIFEPLGSPRELAARLEDARRNAVLIGPGAGQGDPEGLREAIIGACASGRDKGIVLDADALTVFQFARDSLFDSLHGRCVLTPHDGEFARLFPDLDGSKVQRACDAASLSGAIVILKGSDTVIAAPDGRCAINVNGPPELATAGTGDVLSGIVLGLLAQGIPAFEAACASVWIHGDAARRFGGPGLISSDLPDLIPATLRELT